MSMKSKAGSRTAGSVQGKTVKKQRSAKAKAVAKKTAHAHSVGKLPLIKTRTSLVGMKIYPATLEPSDRVKPILKDLAIKSSAA
jgi:hypothetical protein